MSQKESEWEKTKKEFLKELKQALQHNIPYAVNTEFSKFLPEVEKAIDTIVSQREKEIAEEVEKTKYDDQDLEKALEALDFVNVTAKSFVEGLMIVKKSGWNNCADKVLQILKH